MIARLEILQSIASLADIFEKKRRLFHNNDNDTISIKISFIVSSKLSSFGVNRVSPYAWIFGLVSWMIVKKRHNQI